MKCGALEGRRRSFGPILWLMKKCYVGVKEERSVLHTAKWRKASWIGHILRSNCLL